MTSSGRLRRWLIDVGFWQPESLAAVRGRGRWRWRFWVSPTNAYHRTMMDLVNDSYWKGVMDGHQQTSMSLMEQLHKHGYELDYNSRDELEMH